MAHDILPGHATLNRLDGACTVVAPPPTIGPLGPATSGSFYSQARQRSVGYTIAYLPGHGPGDNLPLIVALHGYGGDHTSALAGLSLGQALAIQVDGAPLPPMAMVAADGGGGYWHAPPATTPWACSPMNSSRAAGASGWAGRPRASGRSASRWAATGP